MSTLTVGTEFFHSESQIDEGGKGYFITRNLGTQRLYWTGSELFFGKNFEQYKRAILIVKNNQGFILADSQILAVVNLHYNQLEKKFSITNVISRKIYSINPAGEDCQFSATRLKALAWEYFDLISCDSLGFDITDDIQLCINTECELKALAKYFYTNPELLKLLISLLNGNVWVVSALKLLASNVETSYYSMVSEDLDYIAELGKQVKNFDENSWLKLIYYMRQCVNPTKKFCVVATAKNEGLYLLEFIAYYKELGADAIFIYSNDNQDGSTEFLKVLAKHKIVYFIENEITVGTSAQEKAYTHALSIGKAILDYQWSLFVDLDEFLVFNKNLFSTFTDFLDWHNRQEVHAISINWIRDKGDISQVDWTQPITKRIKRFGVNVEGYVKNIFKPHFFMSSQPHFPRAPKFSSVVFRAPDSKLASWSKSGNPSVTDHPSDSHALILHYFYRSIAEYIWKYSRNRGDHRSFIKEGEFGEGVIGNLSPYIENIETAKFQDSEVYLAPFSDFYYHIDNWLANPEIQQAYQQVVNTTKSRYERIQPLFWNFLSINKSSLVDSFINKYKPKI